MTARKTTGADGINGADDPAWGLFYRESKKDMDARKSIKVKLPIRQHIKLHAMKLFTENNISETVERALDAYFKDMKAADDRAQALHEAGITENVGEIAIDGNVGDGVVGGNVGDGVVGRNE